MYKYKTKYYEILDKENKITKDMINKCSYAYDRNKRFFGKDCKFFQIKVINSENKFKTLLGKIYQPWIKGEQFRGKLIVMRGPKLYKKCYTKFGGTSEYQILLTHEINHIFANQLNLFKGPFWFVEGLAMYVAGQIPGKTYKKKINYTKGRVRYLMFYRFIIKKLADDMYIPHYYSIKYLITKYGKIRLMKLISSYSKNMKKKTFENNFKKIYNISYNGYIKDFISKFVLENKI